MIPASSWSAATGRQSHGHAQAPSQAGFLLSQPQVCPCGQALSYLASHDSCPNPGLVLQRGQSVWEQGIGSQLGAPQTPASMLILPLPHPHTCTQSHTIASSHVHTHTYATALTHMHTHICIPLTYIHSHECMCSYVHTHSVYMYTHVCAWLQTYMQ